MQGSGAGTGRRAVVSAGYIAGLVVAVLLVAFIVQNRDSVRIELFGWDVSARLWLVLTVVAILGAVVGYLLRRRHHH